MSRRVLTDLQGIYKLNIVEGSQGGKLVVEGKIGHCDTPTANGRVYPRSVMEREINRLKPRIEQASVYSVVDHPTDGKTRLKESGAIVRDLWIEPTGEVRGRFEVVEEAPAGQALAAFLRRGASVGMSSRGMGSTTSGPSGHDVVGEDFRLNTWDFVSDPACHDAYPAIVSEEEEQKVTEDHLRARFPKLVESIEEKAHKIAQLTIEEDAKDRLLAEAEGEALDAVKLAAPKIREEMKAEVYAEVRKELREDFAVKLVRALAEMKKDVTEEVRSEMASDPELAGAKLTLKKIAEAIAPYRPAPDTQKIIDEKESHADQLKKQLATVESQLKTEQARAADLDRKGKVLAYAVFIEQKITGRPDAAQVRNMIGPVESIRSPKELSAKVEQAIATADKNIATAKKAAEGELAAKMSEAEERAQAAERRATSVAAREAKLREDVEGRIAKIEESLKAAIAEKDKALTEATTKLAEREKQLKLYVEQNDRAALVGYAHRRLIGHPKRDSIMEAVKAGKLASRVLIDEAATRGETGAAEPGGVSERVRRAMSQGRETFNEEERVVSEQAEAAQLYEGHEGGEAADDLAEIGTSLTEQTKLANGPVRAPGI